jgi:uncharacterized protein with HEPN domain
MSRHNDLLYLDDMAKHARLARRFAEKLGSYEAFEADEFLQPGLIRELEVVGEASVHVSAQFCDAHPDWPWKEMRDTRNRLIHGYADVKLRVVWDTVQDDLPGLIEKLEQVLDKEDDSAKNAPARRQRTPQSKKEGRSLT